MTTQIYSSLEHPTNEDNTVNVSIAVPFQRERGNYKAKVLVLLKVQSESVVDLTSSEVGNLLNEQTKNAAKIKGLKFYFLHTVARKGHLECQYIFL